MTETFAVPCNHADCASKIFYMKYAPYHAPDSLYYMLADTKKLIAQIQRDEPEMIAHAYRKYDAHDLQSSLEYNSESKPYAVGVFAFHEAIKLRKGRQTWQKLKYKIQKFLSLTPATNDNDPGYSVFPGLTLSFGRAESLIVIQKLSLPYVPIAVHKSHDDPAGHIDLLQHLIGVDPVQATRAA